MRIAQFTNTYRPYLCGVTRSIDSFREELARLGHEVLIFAPSFPGHRESSPNVYRYPAVPYRYKQDHPIALPRLSGLGTLLRRLAPDAIHSHHFSMLGREALRQALQLDVPLVCTYHTYHHYYTHYVPIVPTAVAAPMAIQRSLRYCRLCDAVIAPAPGVREFLLQQGLDRPVTVIPTGVDTRSLQGADPEQARRRHGIPSHHTLLLCVSRLAQEKNLGLLLRAFALLSPHFPGLHLMLVGGGYLLEPLRAQARALGIDRRTILTGEVPAAELAAYYRGADVFVYASATETQGLTVTEALASGLPTVAVAEGGSLDLVRDGETGFLVPNDPGRFAQAVAVLVKDWKLRAAFGDRARTLAASLDIRVTALELAALYAAVVEERQRQRAFRGRPVRMSA
jgi:1,2-diacylglycerol 3-alpha-glucosyltransferase